MNEENNTLNDFLESNQVNIGEDFTVKPPIYYEGFHSAIYHYFSSFQPKKDIAHFFLEFTENTRESLSSYSDIFNTKNCVCACQNFFELFLRYQLSSFMSKPQLKRLNGFDNILNQFIESLNNGNLNQDFIFLIEPIHLESIKTLNKWRNKMTHDGTVIPNLHGLDYLISQRIIPLFIKIIEVDLKNDVIDKLPPYTITFSGISILERINKIKFEISGFKDEASQEDLLIKMARLYHLKELGRANLNKKIVVRSDGSSYEWYESQYDDPKIKYESFALLEVKNKYFHSKKICPCCGVNSLIVYRKPLEIVMFTDEDKFISWFKCLTCTYSLKNNIGDPFYLTGIFSEEVFPFE